MNLIRFFKINDIYRFFLLAVLFVAIKGLLFYFGHFSTNSELKFFLVGKFFSQGKWLYRDVWELCEPLTSLLYFLLPSDFSYFSSLCFWLNLLLITYNSYYVNYILQRHDIMSDKTFLPSFFYFLLTLSSAQLSTFSPPLIASFFLLFVIEKTLTYLKKEDMNEMYDAGFFLGLASLCYLPSATLIVALFCTLLFFTRSNAKAYLLLALGLAFPWLIVSVLYLWNGGLYELYNILLVKYLFIRYDTIYWKELGYSFLIPSTLFIAGVFYSLQARVREINYQNICRHFFLVWLLGNVLLFIVSPIKSIADFHIMLPSLVFFFSYYFLQVKKTFVPNLILLSSFLGMLALQVSYLQGHLWRESREKIIAKIPDPDPLKDKKKIWVIGTDHSDYLLGEPSLKYLNWQVSQDDLNKLHHFTGVEHVRLNLQKEKPEVIVDQQDLLPDLFERIPSLKDHYILARPRVYVYRK